MRVTQRVMALSLCCALLPSCTDADLWRRGVLERIPGEPAPPEEKPVRYRIGDIFCTTPSRDLVVPFKLLVVLDYSGSMDESDPTMMRVDAVEQLINLYANEPYVYFGFLRFASIISPLTLGKNFSNDAAALAQAVTELRAANTLTEPQTNYQAALEWCWEAIDEDMHKPTYIPMTRYGIIFVTDGRPNLPEDTGTADGDLLANRPKVRDRITGCDGFHQDAPLESRIEWLNTYFINVAGPDALASQLLRDMATGTSMDACGENNWGHGAFTEVNNAQDLNLKVDLPRMRRTFINDGQVFFFNYNARPYYSQGVVTLVPDSDGDGLVDDREVEAPEPSQHYQSSRYLADTDGDYANDFLETLLGSGPNYPENMGCSASEVNPPLVAGPVQASSTDLDGDGLRDCEERLLSLDPSRFDSDEDGLSDFLEIRYGMLPLDPTDAAADPDGDGVDSRTEVMTGMDPFHKETEAFRESNSYRFTWGRRFATTEVDAGGTEHTRSCYEFSIDNIPFLPVSGVGGQTIYRNILELSFVERTQMPLGPEEIIERRVVIFAEPDQNGPDYAFIKTFPEAW